MRPRIRTIKPEIGADEDLWDLGQETGLPVYQVFTLLWCCADREGRFEWRPRALKAICLPYWDGDFSRVLDALMTRRFLVRYTSGGREYGLVRTFLKHQHINGREPASDLPCPTEPESIQPFDASMTRGSRDDDEFDSRARRDDPFPSRSLPDPDPDPGGAGGTVERSRNQGGSESTRSDQVHQVATTPATEAQTRVTGTAKAQQTVTQDVTVVLLDADRETMCPISLGLPAEAISEMAGKLGVDTADVVAAQQEFVAYWTIGGGAGQRRRNWVARLRQDVVRKHERGQLAGLGSAAAGPPIARGKRDNVSANQATIARVAARMRREKEANGTSTG